MKGRRILVAGIGNIFLGDDGFGCEVARRLLGRNCLPEEAEVVDYGIRGFDLACAISSGSYDAAVLIDAVSRSEEAGTLYTIEPDPADMPVAAEMHALNPEGVLSMALSLGGALPRLLLVGCEPSVLECPDGQIRLSAPVQAAVDEAVNLVVSLVEDILARSRKTGNGG